MEINFVLNIYIISILVFTAFIIFKENITEFNNNYLVILFILMFFIDLIIIFSYVPFLLIKINQINYLMFLIYYIFNYYLIKLISRLIKKYINKEV